MRVVDRPCAALALALVAACRGEPRKTEAPPAAASVSPAPPVEPWSPRPKTLVLPGKRLVHALAFSEDGTRVAATFSAYAADHWQGESAVWAVPKGELLLRVTLPDEVKEPDALIFTRDGGLLVGDGGYGSRVRHTYLRVSPSGPVGEPCEASPPGVGRRPGPQPRGVGSIVELADGRVVTGGRDDSIAVWSAKGCDAEWPRGAACGWAESVVHVGRDGASSGFLTLGETSWRGEEKGADPLGAQRWRGPPWTREAVRAGEVGSLLGPNGQLAPRPAVDGGQRPSAAAIAPDGSCTAVTAGEVAWIEDVSTRRTWRIDLPAKTSHLAVAPRCAAIAAEIEHAVWLCHEGACRSP